MSRSASILQSVDRWLSENHFGSISNNTPLSGGCINTTSKIVTAMGHSFCLKLNEKVSSNFFQCEATSLEHLRDSNTISVPKTIHCDTNYLLLEYIPSGKINERFWIRLGEHLALCHQQHQQYFGFVSDNFCGQSKQINIQTSNGFEFFAEFRLLIQSRWARNKNLLTPKHCKQIGYIAEKLDQWLPHQKPALIHGDLWSGNIYCDSNSDPFLIDPACYWGWPEADLAMTTLFGEFDTLFYQTYQQHTALENSWRERIPLYNLYHLLNHLNLFGSSYLGQIEATIKRFAPA